jgi:hypothetical protein
MCFKIFLFLQNNTRIAVCKHEDGTPLYENGQNFRVMEMTFEWQTCVSLTGTTLDIGVKSVILFIFVYFFLHHRMRRYQDAEGNIAEDGQDNFNFLPEDSDRTIVVLNGVSR